MKELIKAIVCTFFISIALFSSNVLANDNGGEEAYIEYNYVTGEEKEFTVDRDESAQLYGLMSRVAEVEKVSLPYSVGKTYTGVSVNSILPNESLTKVDATLSPYSRVTYLYLGRDSNGDGIIDSWAGGTGFMVYSDIMLTAGHCMYGVSGGNVDEMRIYQKQNSTTRNSTYYYPSKWILSTNFTSSGDSNYDWCVVKLQNSIGNQTGWFGYGVALYSKSVTVSGYPDSSGYYFYQYKNSGTLTINSTYRFAHTCSTLAGESGAPAYDSNGIVWGIHTSGSTNSNYGCLITSSLFDIIESYK